MFGKKINSENKNSSNKSFKYDDDERRLSIRKKQTIELFSILCSSEQQLLCQSGSAECIWPVHCCNVQWVLIFSPIIPRLRASKEKYSIFDLF